jgi:hypothetical protein
VDSEFKEHELRLLGLELAAAKHSGRIMSAASFASYTTIRYAHMLGRYTQPHWDGFPFDT